jgi:hypothetical protein
MTQSDKYITNHLGQIHKGDKKDFSTIGRYFSKNYSKLLPRNKEFSTVNLGCGTRHSLYSLKNFGYRNHIGVDISKGCISFCQKKKLVKKSQFFRLDIKRFLQKDNRQQDIWVFNPEIDLLGKIRQNFFNLLLRFLFSFHGGKITRILTKDIIITQK